MNTKKFLMFSAITALILVTMLPTSVNAQSHQVLYNNSLFVSGDYVWAKSMGGTSQEEGRSIAVDSNSNVYTTGHFQGTVDFEPGIGTANLTSAGADDIFISKLDSNGNFIWAKGMGGTSFDYGWGIAVDTNGNIYATGSFRGTVDFDPGVDTASLSSMGGDDIFISKLDSNGNLIWAKSIGGTGNDYSYGVFVDSSGNVYTTGCFQNTADFDPGDGTANLTASNLWRSDVFVSKLDNNGNYVWAKNMGGMNEDEGRSIVVDSSGNVYTTGHFTSLADFDPGPDTVNLNSMGQWDIFISKLDSSGNFVWAKSMGGALGDYGYEIAVDSSGNVYTTGEFQGTVDFDPGAGITNLTSIGQVNIFVSKLDSNGGFLWAKSMGGGLVGGRSIAVDSGDNVYTTGLFGGTVDFDPGPGTANLTNAGDWDIFISVLDGSGNFIWAKRMGGMGYDKSSGIALDSRGNVHTTGLFASTADFDPGDGTANLISAGIWDIFVSKLGNPNVAPVADAGGPYTVNEGNTVTLSAAASTDPDNNIALYEWDLNADSVYDATGMTTTASFAQIGEHIVTLRVTDAGGLSDTDTTMVTVWPEILHVAPGGLTTGVCESWVNACELQYALTNSMSGQEIWATAGVYKPGTDRTASFQLKSGVEIYGGFAGIETSREQRDWQSNVTILSGDIDNNDVNLDGNFIAETVGDIRGVNTNHIIYASGVDSTAVLDGLTITAGYADYAAWHGGGMYNDYSSPTLRNMVFIGNRAVYGGGLYNNHSNSMLTNVSFVANTASVTDGGGGGAICNNYSNYTLKNVTFRENTGYYGGAIHNGWYNYPTMTNVTFDGNHGVLGGGLFNQWSIPTINDAIFINNIADERGGGIFNWFGSHAILTDVVIRGNTALFGGGMYNQTNSSPLLTNVIVSGNTAKYGGGILSFYYSHPTLKNVTISGNSAEFGGGLFNTDNSQPTIVNTIVYGNSATANGNQICNNATILGNPMVIACANVAKPIISYSDIQGSGGSGAGWDIFLGTDGGGNIDADPLFVDAINGDLHLQVGSPAIDSGTNTNCPATDFDGVLRPQDGNDDGMATCDMGAFEYVRPPNQPPVANAGGPYSVEWGVSITLDGSGSTDPDNNITLYEWDLNADGIYDVTGVTTTTSFTQVGDHLVTLRVTDAGGLSDMDTTTVTVTDLTPPVITPTVSGTLGNNDWYIGNVIVSWDVSDLESGIASSNGCDTTTLTTDTAGVSLTCSATNGVGLSNSASVTVKIDKTPPTIVAAATTDPNSAGWYKDDVTVHFTCDDMLSGIPADACPSDQILSMEGAAVASTAQTVTDVAGNPSGDSNVVMVKIDKTAPVITWISAINDGDSFYFGFVPPAPTCTASDSLSGVDGSCNVSGYASTVGSHTLTAMAKDYADNQATETRSFTVLAWSLLGFYQPVDMNGIFNIAKNGSTIPFKFEIFAGSTELTDIVSIKSFTYAPIVCDANAVLDEIEMTATGGTSLRYDAASGQFIYNWKTPASAGKCYRVTMTTIDGSSLVAYFKFK